MFADQSFSHQMIISLILTTSSLVYILILLGENRLWSLLGLKGLNGHVPRILLFSDNSVLRSLLSALPVHSMLL